MHRWIFLLLLIPSSVFAQGVDEAEWAKLADQEGRKYEKDYDWANALRFYEEAVNRAPKAPVYRYRAAHAAVQRKQFKKARELLEPTLSQGHAPSLNLFATLLFREGQIAPAREWFQKALTLEPHNPSPYLGLAECAEVDFKGGDAAAKSHAIAHYQAYLGRAIDGKERNEAQKRLRVLQYGEPGAALNQAIGVLHTGQYSRAERMLKKLVPDRLTPKLRPFEKEACYWLGVIARNRGETASARFYWQHALPLVTAQVALARQHIAGGEHAEALGYLKAAQRRAPHHLEVSLALGRVYLELQRHEAAENELRRVISEAPRRPEAERAKALLEQLTATSPQAPDWSTGRLTEAELQQRYGGELYDAALEGRLETVVQRLRTGSPELTTRRFDVRVLKSRVPNAWPIPPNKILITKGLIDFVDQSPDLRELADDVLAFILGHEMTHIIEDDTERAAELQPLAGEDVTDFGRRQAILHYIEYKADRRGALMAYQAQFDPYAAMVWCRASQNRYGDSAEGGSHPTLGQREAQLQEFLSHDLHFAHRQFKRGVAMLQKGEAPAAVNAFEMYLAKLPTDTEAQYNLALAYFYLGISHLSEPPWRPWELAKGVAMQPMLTEPQTRDINAAKRWMERAKTEVKNITQRHPSHAASWRLLGDIALAHGGRATAREHYRKALHFRPGDAATRNNLGVLECLQKRWEAARQQFQSCLQQNTITKPVARKNLEQLP